MCYAIPGKIKEIRDNSVIVDYFGEEREALNEFDLKIGDYVYAQAGAVIQKIETEKAEKILEGWKEDFDKLKEIDERLSREMSEPDSPWLRDLVNSVGEEGISKEEALKLMKIENKNDLSYLFHSANKVRQEHLSNSSCIHGIIEFSNHCTNDCLYCGIRRSNKNLQRYRMTEEEIVDLAVHATEKLNFKALVLQSGEDRFYTKEMIVSILKKIRERCDTMVFLSIGERSLEDYKSFYEAGARGVLIRFETSNKENYEKIHEGTKANFDRRIELIRGVKEIGYVISTGFMIGLPNQTDEDIVDDIFFTKELQPDMYSFGPLIPNADTPFKDSTQQGLSSVLKVISTARLIDPESKILVTTALETLDKEGGKLGLL